MRILLIEDDQNTSSAILTSLRNDGFTCDSTQSGEDAVQLTKLYKYDAIILDLMLPDIEGIEFLRRLRNSKNNTPIVIMSGLNGVSDKICGLSAGADDYIEKPCNSKELVARLHAVIRRTMGYAESKIQFGRLSINLQTKTAKADGIPLKLTGKEYGILELMMLKKGYALSKEAFLAHLYDERSDEPTQKIVDVFICKLREKVKIALNSDETYIETVWGRGYMLVNPDSKKEEKYMMANG